MIGERGDFHAVLFHTAHFVQPRITITPLSLFYKPAGGVIFIFRDFPVAFARHKLIGSVIGVYGGLAVDRLAKDVSRRIINILFHNFVRGKIHNRGQLTLTCPRDLTAFSGLDAFVQAFESFTSPRATALTRALSTEAVRKIFDSLEIACKEPENIRARTEMAEGSMLSGMAFSQTGLGAIHGLAHPVGSLLGVPHGLACAILMRAVLEFNMQACADLYADLADRAFIGSDARSFIRAAGDLAEKLNVPENLRSFALHRSDFDFIIKNCRSASMKQNPREMTDRDVEQILEKML